MSEREAPAPRLSETRLCMRRFLLALLTQLDKGLILYLWLQVID